MTGAHPRCADVGIHLPRDTKIPEGPIPATPEVDMINQYVESKMLSEGVL